MTLILALQDYLALSPILILLISSLLLLLIESFYTELSKKYAFYLAAIALSGVFLAAVFAPSSDNPLLTPWLKFDNLARFFNLFFILIGLSACFLASCFFKTFHTRLSEGEFYFLLLSALFGLLLIGQSADFLTLFLGIETLSIALYVLAGYIKDSSDASESSFKYFFMGSLAAAFLIYGIALIYGALGTTNLNAMLHADGSSYLFLGGIAFVTLGLAFEAALVPFQTWAPDVYDGASTPVTAFMAVGTKVGAFAAFLRVFFNLPYFHPLWHQGIALLAIPTFLYANFVAIRQFQLRRFFAYSGMAHAGYLLIPLAAGGPLALSSILFYLAVYAIATLGAFSVATYLEDKENGVMLIDLYGLFLRAPMLALLMTISLLTLAGIPPTAGFIAKFTIFKVGIEEGYLALVITALITTIFSSFYYLRMVVVMFADAPLKESKNLFGRKIEGRPASILGGVIFFALFILIFYPQVLFDLV